MLCSLYVIILIQILIRYNVKNLITACTRSLDFDLKNWKISLSWEGGHSLPDPPPARELRSLGLGRSAPSHLSLFHSVPPPMRWPTVRHCPPPPQSRNCRCTYGVMNLLLIMMDMGCAMYDVIYVIKSVWMSEHALHFVITVGLWKCC